MRLLDGLIRHVDACLATVPGMPPMVIAKIIVEYGVPLLPTEIAHALAYLEQNLNG